MPAEAASSRNTESNRNPEPIRSIQSSYHSLDGFTDILKKDIITNLARAKTIEDLVEAVDDIYYELSRYKADRKNVFIEDEGVRPKKETYNSIIKPDDSIKEGSNENTNVDQESGVTAVAEQEKIYDWIREDMRASEERHRAMEERMEERHRAMEARLEAHRAESEKRMAEQTAHSEERSNAQMARIETRLDKIEEKIDSHVKHVQSLTTTTIIGIGAAVLAVAAIAVTIILSLPWR